MGCFAFCCSHGESEKRNGLFCCTFFSFLFFSFCFFVCFCLVLYRTLSLRNGERERDGYRIVSYVVCGVSVLLQDRGTGKPGATGGEYCEPGSWLG